MTSTPTGLLSRPVRRRRADRRRPGGGPLRHEAWPAGVPGEISPLRKAAIVLVSLEQSLASQLLSHLDRSAVEMVTWEIARLDRVDPERARGGPRGVLRPGPATALLRLRRPGQDERRRHPLGLPRGGHRDLGAGPGRLGRHGAGQGVRGAHGLGVRCAPAATRAPRPVPPLRLGGARSSRSPTGSDASTTAARSACRSRTAAMRSSSDRTGRAPGEGFPMQTTRAGSADDPLAAADEPRG